MREGGQLVGVLPLVRVPERHYGMTLRVLRHIGIWEGERPGVLSLDRPDRIWAAAWDHLKANRAEWQVLDLRELDAGSWPLRELAEPGPGFQAELGDDVTRPSSALTGTWPPHPSRRPEALASSGCRRASSWPRPCRGCAWRWPTRRRTSWPPSTAISRWRPGCASRAAA